jgi:hypothetical protein
MQNPSFSTGTIAIADACWPLVNMEIGGEIWDSVKYPSFILITSALSKPQFNVRLGDLGLFELLLTIAFKQSPIGQSDCAIVLRILKRPWQILRI